MSVTMNANKARLGSLTKKLVVQWRETKNAWRDERAMDFERRYMEELVASVDAAVSAADELQVLLKKARSDCE